MNISKKIVTACMLLCCGFLFFACESTNPNVETGYNAPDMKETPVEKNLTPPDTKGAVAFVGKWEITKDKLAVIQEYMKEKYNYTLTKEQEKEFIEYVMNKKLLALEARAKGYAERKELKIKYEWDFDELLSHEYYNDAVTKRSEVTQEEAKKYYEANKSEFTEVSASHILIKNRELALNLIQRLKGGEKFEDLATQYSEDETTKNSGGDLGFFGRGVMVEEFEKAAFALAPGEVTSKPVQTLYGWHIIKVKEKRSNNFDDSRDKIMKMMQEKKTKQNFDALIKQLRDKYGAGTIK